MRFVVLSQYFPPEVGAPQVRLAAMIRQLTRLGHTVEVVTALPNYPLGQIYPEFRGRFFSSEEWEGTPVRRVWLYPSMGAGMKRLLNYLSFAVTCLSVLARTKRPDYLFVESPPLFLSLPAWLVSVRWRIPFIFNVADLWPDSVREMGLMREGRALRMAERLERWSYRKAGFINAVTEGLRSTLLDKKGVPENKLLFLPNGVDIECYKPAPPDLELARQFGLEGRKIVLYAGTHGYAHGIETALKAARLLTSENLTFVFIGGGSEKSKLIEMAREMALTNVVFLDAVPTEQIARFYTLAFAGLSTLRDSPLFEGTRPVKILASMASGKPVLYSGAGEGARLLQQAKAGLVTPPENPEALAEAVRTLLKDPNRAAEMGQNGRSFVERYLSWPALVQDWLQQLEEKDSQRYHYGG